MKLRAKNSIRGAKQNTHSANGDRLMMSYPDLASGMWGVSTKKRHSCGLVTFLGF